MEDWELELEEERCLVYALEHDLAFLFNAIIFWGDKPCAPPKLKDAKAIAVEPEELRLTTSNCSRLVAHFFANLARSAFFAPDTMSSRERVIILVFRKDLLWRDDWMIDIFACTVAA